MSLRSTLPLGHGTFVLILALQAQICLAGIVVGGAKGDFDCDGDVDQEDWGQLQVCLGFPNAPLGTECAEASLDDDQDVDQADVTMFRECHTAPGVPPPAGCARPSVPVEPAAQTQCAGATARMSVSPYGTGPFTYQWRKDGVDIPGAIDSGYVILTVVADDAGLYDVIVTGVCPRIQAAVPGALTVTGTCATPDVPMRVWARSHQAVISEFDTAGLAVDATGNAYVTGNLYAFVYCSPVCFTTARITTIKYSPDGLEQWAREYIEGTDLMDRAVTAIAVDAAGNAYLTGYSLAAIGAYEYVTLKYDPSGVRRWVNFYTASYAGDNVALAVALEPGGNAYVAGYSASPYGTDYDFATIKYSPDGIQQWAARYNGASSGDDIGRALAVDANGNVYVTGESYSAGTGYDYVIIKYNAAGAQQWLARYNGPANLDDGSTAIAVDAAGNVYVTGVSMGGGTDWDYATVKYNSSGAQLWAAHYNGPGNGTDNPTGIKLDSVGNAYVTGYSLNASGVYDYATIKYDAGGAQQWVSRYSHPPDGVGTVPVMDLDSDAHVYVRGSAYNGDWHTDMTADYVTIKYDPSGEQRWIARHDGLRPIPAQDTYWANALAVDSSGNSYVSAIADGCTWITTKYSAFTGSGGVVSGDVNLLWPLVLDSGVLALHSSWFYGLGSIRLGAGTTLRISGEKVNAPASRISVSVSGPGDVRIDAGQQLIVEGDAVVDLSEPLGPGGSIYVDGRLIARDRAQIRKTAVTVRQAEITTDIPVQYNDIHMVDSLNAGGEFFVQDNAAILYNVITSEGDRYLDLDPDPSLPAHPTIDGNTIHVQILTGAASGQGTLLELRARDADCGPGGTGVNPDCHSGAFQTTIGDRFAGEPAQNWVLESLDILASAKLNLTNRPGFQFQADTTYPETVYVRKLILRQNAVLNTALQALYYESLTDESGTPLIPDPADPSAPMANGSRIVDVPLLGFSLGIIAFNDTTASPFNEFDIRVRTRVRDPGDVQSCMCVGSCENSLAPADPTACMEGSVTRIPNARAAGNGVMELRTKAANRQAASSIAAKGSFARAGQEDIVIALEYQFLSAGDAGNAELVLSLSDKPDVAASNYEVARIRPPAAGLPGSVGSTQYATFYWTVPYEDWSVHLGRFNRGTYVELELRGKGAIARIDNWDPQVTCSLTCGDFTKNGVSEDDFLILLAEYGGVLGVGSPKSCLDSRLNRDSYVDLLDLLNWDAHKSGGLDSCGTGGASFSPPATGGVVRGGGGGGAAGQAPAGLLVCGKPDGAGQQSDVLYHLAPDGACSASGLPPAGGASTRGNGRLLRDSQGRLYQLHGTSGLVRLEDGVVVVGARSDLTSGANTVLVGVTPTGGNYFIGLPINDAVFDPNDSSSLYVVPVLVGVASPAHSYRAAARLVLDPAHPGQYGLGQLYGMDPYLDPLVNTTSPPEASLYNVQKLREIEIDRTGSRLFVTSAQASNSNDWLLVYDTVSGAESRIRLTGWSASLRSPTALFASRWQDKLYLTSSVAGAAGRLFRLDLAGGGVQFEGELAMPGLGQITSIAENPATGTLYAVGVQPFTAPESVTNQSPIFTTPSLAVIQPAAVWVNSTLQSVGIAAADLALPISTVYIPGTSADFNGDGHVDSADYDLFAACIGGPAIPYPVGCSMIPSAEGFIPADFDRDRDVDQVDFGIFQRCYSGTAPVDLSCAN